MCSFFFWLLSLSIIILRFITLLCVSIVHSLLLLYGILLYSYTTIFIQSSIDGHLSYFQFLAIINKAAMNILAQVFVWTYAFTSLMYT